MNEGFYKVSTCENAKEIRESMEKAQGALKNLTITIQKAETTIKISIHAS